MKRSGRRRGEDEAERWLVRVRRAVGRERVEWRIEGRKEGTMTESERERTDWTGTSGLGCMGWDWVIEREREGIREKNRVLLGHSCLLLQSLTFTLLIRTMM